MNYYSNGEFTIEEVERVNGYPLKKTGVNQYQGPCRYCRAEGRDKKGDNLHFNPTKGFFCGACVDNEHGKRLAQEIADSKKIKKQTYKKVTELGYTEKDIEKYQKELFSNKEMLNLVKEKTGLSEEVIREVKIGYSKDSNVFTLPMIALDDSIVGTDLLFTAANFDKDYLQSDEIKLFRLNLENYTKAYQDMTHTEDVFEKFLRIFLLLAKSGKIQYGSEYVFNAKKKELSIYVNGVYQHFKKEFKQSEDSGVIIPESNDIMKQAEKLPFIEYKSKNFGNNKTQRALVITIPENHEMLSYILDELIIYQEELAEREGSKDHAIQTRYAKDKLDEAKAI